MLLSRKRHGGVTRPRFACLLACLLATVVASVGVLAAGGCTGEEIARAPAAITSAGEISIVLETTTEPPLGGDGPTISRATLTDLRGHVRIIDRVVTAMAAGEGALVVTPEGALTWVRVASSTVQPDARDVRIATGVVGEPAVGPDGATFAYVVGETDATVVYVWRDGEARAVSEALGAAGMIAFAPDGTAIAFVGAQRGGVAGLFVASANGGISEEVRASCMTNCALRAGVPFGDDFEPPPGAPEDVRFERGAIGWDANGARYLAPWPTEVVP